MSALRESLRARLRLPMVCAPMFQVTGPELVIAAARAGIVAALPRGNARDLAEFDHWLATIRAALDAAGGDGPAPGPIAVNLTTGFTADEAAANLAVCKRHGVELIITAAGNPADMIARVHDWGGYVLHDVTSMRFAEKAIALGADGLNCIGAGGGGHSGTLSHLAFIPAVRAIYDGVVTMAGAVGSGAVIRTAEILGADLAYVGTRFIATVEARAPEAYKRMLVEERAADLIYTGAVGGAPANWLKRSLRDNGLDPDELPRPMGGTDRYGHLPPDVRPWKTLWSAGQAVELIDEIPTVADLIDRLEAEYRRACAQPCHPAQSTSQTILN